MYREICLRVKELNVKYNFLRFKDIKLEEKSRGVIIRFEIIFKNKVIKGFISGRRKVLMNNLEFYIEKWLWEEGMIVKMPTNNAKLEWVENCYPDSIPTNSTNLN